MSSATSLDEWADRYGKLRSGGPGRTSAWLGIPVLIAALLGLLSSLPIPESFAAASPGINYATLFLMATFVYYCILSISLALAGFVFLIAAAIPGLWLANTGFPLASLSAAVFAASFLWQLLGTLQATGQLRVLANLQLMMLGPLWLLRAAFRRLGLAY